MLIVTVANQDRATQMPGARTDRNHPALSYHRVGVLQLRHVAASVGALLHMRDMSVAGRVRGTRVRRFSKGRGGQTNDQSKIDAAFHRLSVHPVLSSPNHDSIYKDDTCPGGPGTEVTLTSRSQVPRKEPGFLYRRPQPY